MSIYQFNKEEFQAGSNQQCENLYRRTIEEATPKQVFQAVAYAVKDVIIDEWIATHKEYEKQDAKTLYYMSMNFSWAAPWAKQYQSTSGQGTASERRWTNWD